MPWNGNSFPYTAAAIQANAPARSGVYAIWGYNSTEHVVYVGETGDLEERLTTHRNGANTCINNLNPTTCGFELVEADERVARQDALIVELRPPCTERMGG